MVLLNSTENDINVNLAGLRNTRRHCRENERDDGGRIFKIHRENSVRPRVKMHIRFSEVW